MSALAAIDIGSNAIRLAIATVDSSGHYEIVNSSREPVRLGQDVFATGSISPATLEKAVEAFTKFRELIDKHGATAIKAAATSAVREAANGDAFVNLISEKCGIHISAIGPEEEARLVLVGLRDHINFKNKVVLLIDIGGGSVEVSLATHTGIISTESYRMGSVRLLQILDQQRVGEKRFNQLVSKYADTIDKRLKKELGDQKVDTCVGTGGSIESIGLLRRDLFGKNNTTKIKAAELESMATTLQGMTIDERVQQLKLRPDRADVIVPAAIVLSKIVRLAGVEEVTIPGVGLKDGLIREMVTEQLHPEKHLDYDQVMSSAFQLGRKYSFDEPHGVAVANVAVQMFDQTRSIHELDGENRTLLEVAALLHDVGQFVNISDHHKHSLYILESSSVIGLSPAHMKIVANIARYHRKSLPRIQHKEYEQLSPKQRTAVMMLAAILRVANALDREHTGDVREIQITFRKPRFNIRLKGEGEMLLAKWALTKRCDLFESAFGAPLVLEGSDN